MNDITQEEPIKVILDEHFHYVGKSIPSVKERLSKHKQGNRLPRGKQFDEYRYVEVSLSGVSLGKVVLRDIQKLAKLLTKRKSKK